MVKKNLNKFGLSRSIPAATQLAVRRECGFGCVICGEAICEYEHFDPEFKDARDHRVSGVALLCKLCHGKRTSGLISKRRVVAARGNPFCLQPQHRWRTTNAIDGPITVVLGAARFVSPRFVLRIDGENLLTIGAPEQTGGPVLITGKFYDSEERLCLTIENNIYEGSADAFDAKWTGQVLCIRRARRDVALRLRLDDSTNTVTVETCKMHFRGITVSATSHWVRINRERNGVGFRGEIFNPEVCIDVKRASEREH